MKSTRKSGRRGWRRINNLLCRNRHERPCFRLALKPRCRAAAVPVVGKLFPGEVIPLFSDAVFKEYKEVLRRAKFRFSEETVRLFLQPIETYGERVVPTLTGELLPDRKDLPFYEAAAEKQKDDACPVTGNKRRFPDKLFIVSAEEFLEILNSAE